MMADVFISYAREDAQRAGMVARALEATGMEVFWDSEIPPGQTWADYIESKLTSCKAVVVLWSEHSTRSQWVREEARMGRDKGKLIPAMLDNSPAPFGFGEVQAANLSSWSGEENHPDWQRTMAAVRSAVEREGGAQPPIMQPAPARPEQIQPAASISKTMTWDAPQGAAAKEERGKPWWRTPWAIAGGGVLALLLVVGIFSAVSGGGGGSAVVPPKPVDTAAVAPPPVTPPQPAGTPPQGQDYQAILHTQLQQVTQQAGNEGFQVVGQPYMSGLAQAGEQAVPVELHAGYDYRIVAVCDRDCTDIDLRLFDENNIEVATDTAIDDQPVVQVAPIRTATFSLKVVMATCNVAPCYYAAQLYGRARSN